MEMDSESSDGIVEIKEELPEFLEMQERYNICMAAYKELMTMAVKANTWVVHVPVVGAVEDRQQLFRFPTFPGMEIDCSIESGIVPYDLDEVLSILTDVHKWASVFCNIVHLRTDVVPSGVMCNLLFDAPPPHHRANFKNVKTINAELALPTPFMPTRKFSFIRFLRQVISDVWAVVDVSTDYFQHMDPEYFLHMDSTPKTNCRRRPSGVIIRRHDDHSEVIWIENMEVQKCNVQDNICSRVINSNLAFGAKRWMSMLSTNWNANRFVNLTHRLANPARESSLRSALPPLTRRLKKVYLDYTTEQPDETKWNILSEKAVKIFKEIDAQGNDNNYLAVTTFRVEATPHSVFNFLITRTRELQWPHSIEEPEELINFVTDDDLYCISLHEKSVMQTESTENFEYVLQEASRDEFCSFIIASPISQSDFDTAVGLRNGFCILRPFGFSIIPDGSERLLSDASIVTMAFQQEFDADLGTDEVIEKLSNHVTAIVGEINEQFITVGDEATEM